MNLIFLPLFVGVVLLAVVDESHDGQNEQQQHDRTHNSRDRNVPGKATRIGLWIGESDSHSVGRGLALLALVAGEGPTRWQRVVAVHLRVHHVTNGRDLRGIE